MSLLNLLFPPGCLSCGRTGQYVCPRCVEKLLHIHKQTCMYCASPSMWGLTHPSCLRQNGIDGFIALFFYNTPLKKIIAGIKYRLVRDAFYDLLFIVGKTGGFLFGIYRKLGTPVLVSIPLSGRRLRGRGFNQTKILVRIFSHLLLLPEADVLVRRRETPPQAQTALRTKRIQNLRHAFALREGVRVPPSIILVDDVVTTGATVKEAARVLKMNGAKRVYVLAVAKGR